MDLKVYKNANDLMAILESKGMVFSQPVRAKRLIIENNYYSITAFKHLFYKKEQIHILMEQTLRIFLMFIPLIKS